MRPGTAIILLFLIAGSTWLTATTDPGYAGLSPRERQTLGLNLPGVEINTFNGNLIVTEPLFVFPGRGLPIECYLVYNSDHRAVSSFFGRGWGFSYHIRYLRHGNGDITIAWGTGRQDRFLATEGPMGGFTAPTGVTMTLSEPAPGQVHLRSKHGIGFHFNNAAHRKLTHIADPNGNQVTLAYDHFARLQRISDASGRMIDFTYDRLGRLSAVHDRTGQRTYQCSYDALDRLLGVTNPLMQAIQYSYDSDHLITGITDRRGHRATISYVTPGHDPATRLPAAVTKDVSATTFAFDRDNRKTTVSDARHNDSIYTYDAMGRLTTLTDANAKSIGLTWDGSNNLVSYTDRNSHTHSYSYDNAGNRLTHVDPLGETRTWTYESSFNRITSYEDRNGNTWGHQYDGNGNHTRITDPLSKETTITYDVMGQPTTSTNPAMETTTYTYDAHGNMHTVTDPLGGVRTHTYDTISREIEIKDANGHRTTYSYDAINRLTGNTDHLGHSTNYTYDPENNPLTVTDARGTVTRFTYDALGRRTASEDGLNNTQNFAFDAMGNLTSHTGRRGNSTLFDYDSLGRLTARTTPRGHTWTYGYDCERNQTSRVDPMGRTITRTFDDLNRVATRTLPGGITTTYSYDPNGNLLGASQPGSTISRTFDALNRLATETDVDLGKTLTVTYSDTGSIEDVIRPDSDTQNHEYDAFDRITRITADGQTFDYSHDPGNRRTQIDRPGGVTTGYTYDAINRIVLQETSDGVDSLSQAFDYSGGQLLETREDGSTNTHSFDALNRLTRDVRTGTPAYDFNYSYDPNGNLTGNSGTTPFFPNDALSITHNADNQIVTETGTDFGGAYTRKYTYDDNGNLILKAGTGISSVTYVYDALNRLISAADSVVGSESYTYDALGRLSSILVTTPVPGELGYQRFFYDQDNRIIINYGMAGAIQEQYWHNRGSVLFSTFGGIDPVQSSITMDFTDSGLNDFSTAGADDFTVPDSGWEIETPGIPGTGSDTSQTNRRPLYPDPISISIDGLRPLLNSRFNARGPAGKPVKIPKPPKDGSLFGYPGHLGGKMVPLPPRDPRYGFPRFPDDYLLRKVATTRFFLIQDAFGNITGGITGGLAGIVKQLYDLLKRIVVGGDPGPIGPGGQAFYRPRINSILGIDGLACENYTTFHCNQPLNMDAFDTPPLLKPTFILKSLELDVEFSSFPFTIYIP